MDPKDNASIPFLSRWTAELDRRGNDFYFFLHLIIAAFCFSPFFLFGHIFAGGFDGIHLNLPMMIQAKRNLLDGTLDLWNPYLSGGMSTTLYALFPELNPLRWPLFLVPESHLFFAFTLYQFFAFYLTGVVSYLLFQEEFHNRKWAFFASVTFLLSGFTMWGLTSVGGVNLWLMMLVSLYLIWSYERRGLMANFIWLTLSLFVMLICDNLVYAVNALFLIGLLAVYRLISHFPKGQRIQPLLIGLAAMTVSGLWIMPHLLPFLVDLKQLATPPNRYPLFFIEAPNFWLRLLVPEVFGINDVTEAGVIASLGITKDQPWAPHYFGIVAGLLAVLGLCLPLKGRANFWAGYVVVVFLAFVGWNEPFETLMKILFWPYFHMSLFLLLPPIGFCMFVGHVGCQLEGTPSQTLMTGRQQFVLFFTVIALAGVAGMIWTLFYSWPFSAARPVLILFLAVMSGWCWMTAHHPEKAHRVTTAIAVAALLAPALCWPVLADGSPDLLHDGTTLYFAVTLYTSLALIFLFCMAIMKNGLGRRPFFQMVSGGVLALLLGVTLGAWVETPLKFLSKPAVGLIGLMGLGKLFIVFGAFLLILIYRRQQRITANTAFCLLAALLILDLVPAFKLHSFYVMNPFYAGSTLYPQARPLHLEDGRAVSLSDLELQHYRVNRPAGLLRPPLFEAMFGRDEPLSAYWQLYGVRSYGGYVNLTSHYYTRLYNNFNKLKLWKGAYTDQTDPRFLDLFGVKYAYRPDTGVLHVRPEPLSRFMWFSRYEVLELEDDALKRLKAPEFDPRQILILNTDPGLPDMQAGEGRRLDYETVTSDELRVSVSSAQPGLVFFNDSYHPGWQAAVNGTAAPILRAHHNFMAVAVPAGPAEVVFRFAPPPFGAGIKLAGVGLLVFALAALRIRVEEKKQSAGASRPSGVEPNDPAKPQPLLQRHPKTLRGLGALLILSLIQLFFNF
ncbi:YfhO family protein [Nitrospina gracilis]|uniref:YfhO family protein n=1 Tax=Nitrospina gracilis TaxID=35801 RepID=UPI001F307080|nr:YfhO family protein [Nitrospina gracilis]MCF8721675.1 hypothetical protein [Nitrospina gracilis Nb-211]